MTTMEEIYENLAIAFGGYSQIPDAVIGMALIGQINNHGLNFTNENLDEMVNLISNQWNLNKEDEISVRNEILDGMRNSVSNNMIIPDSMKAIWENCQCTSC